MAHERTRGIWRPLAGASADAIDGLLRTCPIPLPESYLDQLRQSDGGEGDLAVEPGWVVFWPADEIAAANREYGIAEFVPGLYAFGSNGGGELLAFDCRGQPPYPIVMVPCIPMDWNEVNQIASDFDEFRDQIGFSSAPA